MKLKNEFQLIRNWGEYRGIMDQGDVKTQYIKLQEEAGELDEAILNEDEDEIIDAIGDCVIVLTNLANLAGHKIEDCINQSYKVIEERDGEMINGTFKKN